MTTSRKRKVETPYRSMKFGKGVDALFGESPTLAEPERSVNISEVFLPTQQPRRYFDPQAMEALVESIRRDGILEPLLVRYREAGGYELVAGERRYRAATSLGLTTLPVVIRHLTDEQSLHITLVENLLREDLNPLEETEGILQLLTLQLKIDTDAVISLLYRMQNDVQRLTHNVMGQPDVELIQMIFNNLGIAWESFINNRLSLLKLPKDILEALREGKIAYTKAQSIARVKDESQRQQLLSAAIAEDLSLSQIKEQIAIINAATASSEAEPASLKKRFDIKWQQVKKSKIWDDPKKKRQMEKLLTQLEVLLQGEEA